MLNYSIFINNKDLTQKFAKYSKLFGIIFLVLGVIGMIFPQVMAISSALYLGWLLLFSGIMIAVQTWQVNKKDWLGWLKALMFIIVAALVIIDPISGVVALAILFTSYFLVDSILNFSLAFSIKPNSGWFIVLLNALLSLAIGIYFFMSITDPIKTMWLVGFLVGVSLFFDGIMLLTLASAAKKEK